MENQNQNVPTGNGDNGKGRLSSDFGVVAAPQDYNPDSLSLDPNLAGSPLVGGGVGTPPKRGNPFGVLAKKADLILAVLLVLVVVGVLFKTSGGDGSKANQNAVNSPAANFRTQSIPLTDFVVTGSGVNFQSNMVAINGALTINGELVVSPSLQPEAPKAGQLYYDQVSNVLAYYNGTGYVVLSGEQQVVQSLGGLSGQVGLAGGLSVVGNQLVNAGVVSLGGASGSIVLGNGLSLANNVLQNTGILNVTAGTPNVTITNNGGGNISVSVVGAGTGTVASSGGANGTIPVFTASQNIENSIITQSGANVTVGGGLSVTGALALGSALTVANGGTGATSLTANGVIVGNGTGALGSVAAGGAGLCLLSTAGAPAWGACPGGGGVTSLNSLSGALSIANASAAGSTVTINDASTSAKGIAQFNATNFSASGGVINTIQNINSGATPTFAGLNTNSITPSGALTVGAAGQTALLQGSTVTVTSNSGGDIVLTSSGQVRLTGFNCTTFGNGGTLTTDVSGNLTCANDDGGASGGVTSLNTLAGALTLAGTAGQITVNDNGTDTITLALNTAVTLQGNTFNGANQLVQLNASSQLPAISGALLTNLNASALASGTVPSSVISGSYTGITGVGTVTVGTWQGTAVADGFVADNLTISSGGTVDWTALTAYPTGCSAGQAVTAVGDTLTCASFAAASGSGSYINNTTTLQTSANLNVQSGVTTNVTANFQALASQTADIIRVRNATDTVTVFAVAPSGAVTATSFTGDGSGLTALNGTNISSGTVANARLVNSGALTVTAGTGLSGGGSVALGGTTTLNLADTAVTPGAYGSASQVATFTVDQQGRLTAAGNASIAIAGTQVTSGTINDARLSANVTVQGNTFNGANQLVQLNASSELPAVSGANLTALNATQLTSGTVPSARVSGSYTGITGVGTIGTGVWQGTAVADGFVADNLTISSAGSVDWTALTNYPTGCSAGQAVTAVGDTLTCASFASASGSGSYINNTTTLQTSANFNVQSGNTTDVTANFQALTSQTADIIRVRNAADTVTVFAVAPNGAVTATSFAGDGSALTALNGTNISTGTVANARLVNGGALTVTAGTGLSGGGSVALGGTTTLNLADTAVTPGPYGSASQVATFTVDQQGRLTAAGNTSIAIAGTQVTSGTINDARLSANVTVQGNTFNGASQLVQLNALSELPAVSGVNLTALNATQLTSGTVPSARVSGSYTGITGVGTIGTGVWQGTAVADGFVADNLTISSGGNVDWTALSNYPTGCSAGQAVTAVGDTLTCAAFAAASGSSSYINNTTTLQTSANFNIQSGSTTSVTANFQALASQTADIIRVRNSADTVTVFAVNPAGDVTATSYTGDGSGLTALNGSNISTGTVANARLVNSGALTVTAGTGLSGGGSVALGGTATVNLADTAVTLGSYGSASQVATFTVDQQGRLTAAGNTSIAIAGTQITSGTVNDARLSANVTVQGNTFNGASQLVQLNVSGELPAISGVNLTSLNATQLTSGTVPSARISGSYTGVTGVGTIAAGTWQGTAVAINYGGTGASTSQGAINAISQLTTQGDLLYHDGTNSTRLARGSNGDCLVSTATGIQWGSCSGGTGITGSGASGQVTFFNGTSTVTGDADLLFDGTTLATNTLSVTANATVGGTLAVQGSSLTLGTAGPTGTTGSLVFQNSANANTATIQSGTTGTSYALTLPTGVGSTNQCLKAQNGTGTLFWDNCEGGAGGTTGVSSVNSLDGALTVQGTTNHITVNDNGTDTITLDVGSSVTLQGNTFNGANQLVQLNVSGELPAISGVNLTNLNASNLASGTVASARISGSYTGITGVGTIGTGTWQGTAVADTYVADNLTISSSGTVDWTALTAYPTSCSAGQAVTAVGDTLTCAAFAAASGSTSYINNDTALQTNANFNVQSAATTSVTANFRALASQTADIIRVRNSADTVTVFAVNPAGDVAATSFAGDGSALTALNATQLTSGTVASARISGSYTGVTGVGTVTVGTWQGTAVADTYVADNLTISSSGNVDWTALSNYPTGCSAGNAVTAVGDTLTCAGFAPTSGSASYINNTTTLQTSASFNIQSANTTDVTANFRALGSQTVDIIRVRNSADTVTVFAVNPAGDVTATSFTGNGSGLTSLNASNLASGTVPSGVVSGSYTGITGVGTIGTGTWQGTAVADTYVADNLTISSAGTVDWTALNNYPTACSAGQAVTAVGDTLTCAAFAAASGSGSYINNTTTLQTSANFNIQTAATTSVTANFQALASQTADIIRVRNSADTVTVFAVNPAGDVTATSFTGDGSGLTALNATQLTSGTVASARISGSYTGITGVGTITTGTWQGTAVADTYVADNLTISSSGNVDWTALSNYPTGCSAGQAVTAVGDTLTCAAFAAASGSSSYINNTTTLQTSANFNIQSGSTTSVTANFQALASQTADIIRVRNSADTVTVFAVNPAGDVTATSYTGDGSALTALNATQLTSGTVASARISGSYTGITGVGTIGTGTWQGTAVADTYVADNLTISSSGTVDWTALNSYPTGCSAGNAVTAVGDTLTCAAFAAASGSASYINNATSLQTSANFNIQTAATTSVTANFQALASQTADVLRVRNSADTVTVFAVNPAGDVTATSFSGNGSGLTSLNGSNISSGTVANARLTNSGALTVTAGTGLSGGGSVALGGSTSLSVSYGSSAGTAVQGDTTLTCPSGTGNLSGGGTVVTLGTGGTCGAIDTVASPTFTGNVTIQGVTGLTFNTGAGGDITFANGEKIDNDTNGTINLQANSGAITALLTGTAATLSNSAGDLTLDSASGRLVVATGDFLNTSVAGVTGAAAGDIWYDSTAGKFKINEAVGGTKTLCNMTDLSCGAGATTPLQTAYNDDVDGSDAIIQLTTADDSIIFRNPAASGTDSGYVFSVDQLNTGAVDGFRLNTVGTGVGQSITLANTSGTQTNGLLVDRNGAGGTTTNGINITNTAGTLTNGLAFTGTIGTDINRASGTLTLQGGGGVSIKTANSASTTGSITIQSGNSSGASAGTITIDSGTWSGASLGWVAIGATNANLINLGNATSGTALSIESGTAASALQIGNGNTAHGIQIGTGAAAQTIVLGSMNTTSSTTIQGGSNNITLQTNGASTIVKSNTTNSASAFQVQNASAVTVFDVDTTNQRAGINTSTPGSTFQVNQSNLAPGTVSNSASSASVTGSSTTFFSTFQRGDTFTITSSGNTCTVLSIASDTALTCTATLAGSSSGSAYSFTQQARVTVRDNGTTSLNGTVIISSPTANNQFTFRNDTSDNTLKIGSSIIGNASSNGINDSNASYIQATKFNSGPGGTVTSVRVFFPVVDGANPHFKVAVYSDSAGSPNSLLSSAAASSTTATAGQWNTAPLGATVTLTPNTDYWLATTQESGSTEFRAQNIGASTTKYQSGFTYSSNFPATYTVNNTSGHIIAIYAPYTSVTDQSNVTGALKISENNEVSVRPIYNSDTALQVLKADGTQIFNVNTFDGWTGVEQLMVGSVDTSYNAFIAGNRTNGALGVDRGSSTATDSIMELFSSVGGAGTLQMKVTADGTLQLAGGGLKNITTASASTATAISVQPGDSTANNATGAAASLVGGDTTTGTCATACNGGTATLQGGDATNGSGTRNGGSVYVDAGTGSTANGTINIGTLTSADMTIGKTTGGNSLLLQAGQNVTILNNNSSGTIAIRTATNSSNGIQLQDSASAPLLTADTAARSGSGGNLIKIGNSTGTDTATTILQLDSATADPTTNLSALNGGLFYNSTTNKLSLIENGVVKIFCNTTDLGCGTGTVTLQSAYNNSTNPEITLGSAATAGITIRNNSTPISGNLFEVQNNAGTSTFLSTTTTGVGVNIGNNSPSADLTFGDGADRIINVLTRTTNAVGNSITLKGGNGGAGASANAGGNVVLQGGDAAGTGAADGGNIVLQPGIKNGAGEGGQIIFNNAGGRADFFVIKSASGEEMLRLYDPSSSGHYNNYLFLGGPCCSVGTPYRITFSEQGAENYVDIGIDDSTANDGKNLILHGGNSTFTNGNGGAVILTGGGKNGTGVAGGVTVKNAADGANGFRVQNAAGTTDYININTSTSAVALGNSQTGGSIALGAAMTTGTITIGGTGAQTGTITLGGGTGAQTVNLGTGNTGVKTVNLGTGTAANVISIGTGQTGGSISLGTAMTTGTISIGGTGAQTGAINIGAGTGAQALNFGTGGTGAKTVTIGSTASTGATTIQSGSGHINLQAAGTGTIDRIQIGAGGAGSATPDFLALDVKSSTGDPAGGAEGYMYYNTFDNKFRCFQNTGWTDCIPAGGSVDDLDTVYANDADKEMTINNASGLYLNVATGAGDLNIQGNGTSIASFTSTGQIDLAPIAGQDLFVTLSSGTSRFRINTVGYSNGVGTVDITKSGSFTGAAGESGNELRIAPTVTLTEPGTGTFTYNGQTIDFTGLAVTGAAGTTEINGLDIQAVSDADVGTSRAINIESIAGTASNEIAAQVGTGWDIALQADSGDIITSNLGVNFTDSDTNPSCAAGEYKIYADTSETKLKKCMNGTATDLDTGGSSGVTTVGAFSGSSQTNGANITGTTITFGPADGTNPGMVSTGSQTFAGSKTFTGQIIQNSDNAAAFNLMDSTGTYNNLLFDSSTNHLKVYDHSAPRTAYVDIYYSGSTAVIAASTGATQVGNGTGDVNVSLTNNAERFNFSHTGTNATSSDVDFLVQRNLTGTTNNLQGAVMKVEDLSTFTSGSSASDVLSINQNNTSATGNLIVARLGGGSNDKFKVNTAGTVTVAAGQSYTSAGALTVSSGAATALTVTSNAASTWSTTSGNLTIQAAGTSTLALDTGGAGTVSIADTNATTVAIATNATAHTVNIANGGAVQGVTIGSTNSTSSLTLQAGTGNLSITTQGGTLGIGTNAVAQTINIGNATGATVVNIKAGTGNITLGTSDTTGTLLVLDTKTDSTDPTGVNGGMYYNSNLGRFRCYEGSAWTNCTGLKPTYLASDQTQVNGGGTYTTLFTIPLTASKMNVVQVYLPQFSSATTVGIRNRARIDTAGQTGYCTFTNITSATATALDIIAVGTAPTDTGDTAAFATTNPFMDRIECTVSATATPGNLIVDFTAETTGTVTTKAGAYYTNAVN